MEKIWVKADRAVLGIGRLALRVPIISGLFIVTAIIVTLYCNGAYKSAIPPLNFSLLHVSSEPIANLATADFEPILPPATADKKIDLLEGNWQIIRVRSRDSLSKIFKRIGVSAQDLVALAALKEAKPLKKLAIGEQIQVLVDDKRHLQRLVYFNEDNQALTIIKTEQGLKVTLPASALEAAAHADASSETPVAPLVIPKIAAAADNPIKTDAKLKPEKLSPIENEPKLHYASGEIHKSLYADARKLGLTAKQAHELEHIFSVGNIVSKLHPGDHFSLLYEFAEKGQSGHILVAQLNTKKKEYRLVRFTDPHGHTDYYTANGETLRPGLNRAPTHYSHISSKFANRRLHPLLGFVRRHDGVDYAAHAGTPITAAGPGVVTAVHYRGGYGKMVEIKHDGKYSTLYAHMSRFASHLKPGSHVAAGQVIGYVGNTGFSTGAHLHFEVHVNGRPMDPLTVELPNAVIPKAYRNKFLAQSRMLLAQLNTHKKPAVQLAQNPVRTKPS